MEINQGSGNLYRADNEQLLDSVKYQLHEESSGEPTRWWGEFTLVANVRIQDNERYIIELEDGRKGMCYLKKRVNRAVSGVPPRYLYHFTGISSFE